MRKESNTFFRMGRRTRDVLTAVAILTTSNLIAADLTPGAIARLSIEELMSMEVTSVSKKPETMSAAAAAVFVITSDDIRRSGATTIPDVLRMAPGLHVARIDASTWAVSARGYNGYFANKLLVLIDGRSVYTPTFSGVYWDVQDTLLSDIERIEVIRGPGAALWGANAVNGVINILTKSSRDTQGTTVTLGGGTEERKFTEFRHGSATAEGLYYRFWAKGFDRDDLADQHNHGARDDWQGYSGGFRIDRDFAQHDAFTLSGDVYSQDADEWLTLRSLDAPFERAANEDKSTDGGNILARWSRRDGDQDALSLQLYYDRLDRRTGLLEETYDTIDIEFQHRFGINDHHEIIWGLGYRLKRDRFRNSFDLRFSPERRDSSLFSAFVQDSLSLADDRLNIVLGSKFEHNDYTGFEIQPTIRFLLQPAERHSIWAAASRAVRTPARNDHDATIIQAIREIPSNPSNPNSPELFVVKVEGNDRYEAEELQAYELGYRVQAHDRLSLDFAGYYNRYDNFRSLEFGATQVRAVPPPLRIVQIVQLDNKIDGDAYGGEAVATWLVQDWWRCYFAATIFYSQLYEDNDSTDTLSEGIARTSPHQQYFLRSSFDLPGNIELDLTVRFVDNITSRDIDKYTTADVRLAWRPTQNLEISIVGENLTDDRHREFEAEFLKALPTENERHVYGKITWEF